jgi:hypothetical protein
MPEVIQKLERAPKPNPQSELIEMALRAQFLANACGKPQFLGSYEQSGQTHYYIAQMVSKGCPGTWVRPSASMVERAVARRRYAAEYSDIPE